MMGRKGSSSTIGAVHVGAGLMSLAVGRAMQDGIERAAVLRQVDRAHAVGRQYLMRQRAIQELAALDEAKAAGAAMLAERKRLHRK